MSNLSLPSVQRKTTGLSKWKWNTLLPLLKENGLGECLKSAIDRQIIGNSTINKRKIINWNRQKLA